MQPHAVTEEKTLLAYLVENFPRVKRTKAKQILKYGSAEVNGQVVTLHSHLLNKGDRLRVLAKDSPSNKTAQLRLSFPIVYEDRAIIVIDKPAGLLTMGTDKDKINTAYFELTNYVRFASPGGLERIFIVHRLDREASGLLVFAKTESAKLSLQKNWDKVNKKYFAIVEGKPAKLAGTIESHLVEDKFMRVYSVKKPTEQSKHAITHYQVIRSNDDYSLLEVLLETGRKNQIRVHLSDLGHPIIGDEKYGSRANPAGRIGLHAHFLQFNHPETGVPQTFESNLPPVLASLI